MESVLSDRGPYCASLSTICVGVDSPVDLSLSSPSTISPAEISLGGTASSGVASPRLVSGLVHGRGRPLGRRDASVPKIVKPGRRTAAQHDAGVPSFEVLGVRNKRDKSRIAADKCRSRKRFEEEKLKHNHEILEVENRRLLGTVSDLMAETHVLKNMLVEHGSCDCQLIHEYLKESAWKWVTKKLSNSYSSETLKGPIADN